MKFSKEKKNMNFNMVSRSHNSIQTE